MLTRCPTTTSSSSWASHASRPWRRISTWCAPSSRRDRRPLPPRGRHPGRHRRLRIPFAIELMKLREQSGIASRSACATRWASASAIPARHCRGACPRSPSLQPGCGRPRAPARVARPQRFPQGPRQRHDGLALRLRRRQRHAVRLSASGRATRRSKAVIIEYIQLKGEQPRDRHDSDHGDGRLHPPGDEASRSPPTTPSSAPSSTSPGPASTPTGS